MSISKTDKSFTKHVSSRPISCSLKTTEALALLEELSNRGDVHIGLLHNIELFDGDSGASDDEAGNIHAFDIYTGKKDGPNETENAFGLGGNVVLDLIDAVGAPDSKGFEIFFDNYFTSIQVMEKLFEKGICASRTCRENKTARCPFKTKTEMKARLRGAADFKSTSNIVAVKWKDNNDVVLLSNFETYKMSTVERYDRPQKKYVPVPQPENIQNYNKYMGFADLLGHKIGSYRILMWQNKWCPILSYFVSVATRNSCILMNRAGHKITLCNFIENMSLTLMKKYGTPKFQRKQRKRTSNLKDNARYDGVEHWIEYIPNERRCNECSGKRHFICKKCDVAVHPKCFKNYHV
ncbi:Hypothetical predicted protein [Octopus vulgaris]|uniref:PiggyBac transposable element-derived protein domain-containing protein n=1 Tax=Octopus vulgaris TaxID=6645 RepID=A0AA36B634_OCTVU|nr:Hypothetical predicted protein [Octopus vulgaris]